MAQTYKYTVVGDTQPAVKGNEALDASIKQVDTSSKQLESSLAKSGEALELSLQKQDAKIKAIGGSINILGGSVELVVGSLGLIGVDEKIVGEFQKAAVSAIAFADGAKRVFEGYKEITEAKKIFSAITKTETAAQAANTAATVAGTTATNTANTATKALNATILKNPYVLAAAAVAALVAGIYLLVQASDDEIDTAKKLNAEYKKQQQNLKDLKDQRDKILAAQGETDVERLTRLIAENQQELQNARDRAKFYAEQKFQGEDLNNQLTIIRNAKLQQPVLEAQLAAAVKDSNEKIRAENKKTAEELAKQNVDAAKAAEALRVARLKAAQEGAEGLIKIETDVRTAVLNKFLELNQKLIDEYEYFPLDEENILLLQETLKDIESTTREIRLQELDKTTGELLEANKAYFDQIVEGVKAGSKEYIEAEEQFQDNIVKIIQFYGVEKRRIESENSEDVFNINAKARELITQLAFDQGEELLKIEGATYAELKKGVIDYYDAVIAAAKAAGIATVELENQKAKLLDNIDDQRRKDIEEGIRNTLSGLSSFLSQQRGIIDSQLQADLLALGNNENAKNSLRERAFEQQKKLRIAEATISGLTGAIDAFNSVQNLNKLIPGLGIAVGLGLAGSVAAITAQQIALIAGSSLNGGNTSGTGFNNVPSGGGFSLPGGGGISTTPSLGAILPGLGGGRIATPTIGTIAEPIRAYVLTGDISNGMQAGVALNNRRRLSGG
jgi:hypothetical protein